MTPLHTTIRSVSIIILAITVANGCKTTQTPNDLINLGNQYARDGLLREASDTYKEVLNSNPDNPVAKRNLALVLVKLGAYDQAIVEFEGVIQRFSNNFDTNYYLAEAYRAKERYADAIFRYQMALKISNSDPKSIKALAWSYYKIRYYSQALSTIDKLKTSQDGDGQGSIIKARILLKLNRSREALTSVRQGMRRMNKANRPYFHSVEGDIRYKVGQLDRAMKAYKSALNDQPLLAGALLGVGRIHYDRQEYQKAISFLERSHKINPKMIEANLYLGKSYESINRSQSIKYYRSFFELAAADPEYINQIGQIKTRVSELRKAAPARKL
jgi:tetratricopeptide (TPR) repeat protein